MTDITELAQSLKSAADREMICRDGAETSEIWERTVTPENILALVEALEKAQRYIEELREWNAGLAQESFERQQRISELLEGKVGNALLERENHHVEVAGKLAEHIAELESRTVIVKLPQPISVLHRRDFTDAHRAIYAYPEAEVNAALAAAGIKVEAE
ncbi:TPA: ead/Ea22-like family protein [Klebsiella variicola]|nr:ead/Ea22-like family protein [Klebsiella variicola]